ncbi:MAG: hypothetical protein BGO25_20635 [Acidobacteriales bacterium 59-55]|nr:MAG: hypothetical protein BGO25_20635 [Acidobacteriales bacterium 59-55]
MRRGGKAQREGVHPPGAERRASAAKVCTSEARKTGETLAPRQGKALSGLSSAFVRSRAQDFQARVAGGNEPVTNFLTDFRSMPGTTNSVVRPMRHWI